MWDWVPAREGEDPRDAPSPGLRRTFTVLLVVFTAVLALYFAQQAWGTTQSSCVEDRPAGVPASEVSTTWRWWPPGQVCDYPETEGSTTMAADRPAGVRVQA